MPEVERSTDPSTLEIPNITIQLSSLNIGAPESSLISQRREARLILLQPLASPDILETCRNLGSRSNGSVSKISPEEYLNIEPLSKAWRQVLKKAPPISYLIFDLSLPKQDENSQASFQRVYWDTATFPREGGGLTVCTRDVMTLVITIATGMRMRVDGQLRFDIFYDEDEGVSVRAMTLLKKQLLALAETRALGLESEQGVSEGTDDTGVTS